MCVCVCVCEEAYSGSSLAMVTGLHSPEQRHAIARLPLKFPESDKLWNELRLLVQAHTSNDAIKSKDGWGDKSEW